MIGMCRRMTSRRYSDCISICVSDSNNDRKCDWLLPCLKTQNMSNYSAAIIDAITEAANLAIPRGRPNGRRRKYKPLPYWSDDCNAVSDKNMTSNILTKNKANTTLRLEHRRLKGVEQAVIKYATRVPDDHQGLL